MTTNSNYLNEDPRESLSKIQEQMKRERTGSSSDPKSNLKQSSATILANAQKSYKETEDYLRTLEAKKQNLESEIQNLKNKQSNRKKFIQERLTNQK